MELIRSAGDPDRKEARLRQLQGGSLYRQIYKDYYPQLRRSDYRIEYSIAPFSAEKGKEVLYTRPGDLSLNEMFMIANTYKAGSAEFNKVFETAAQLFPASDEANLNAAASALGRNDITMAARYLGRVKVRNEVYWNNMGVLAWQQGDIQRASECFAKGGAYGTDNAAELLKHLESRTNR